MGFVFLTLLYLATAAALWLGAAGLARRRGRRAPSAAAAAVLTLLPLAFTASGFLPGRALTPTPLLAGVPPWSDPEEVARIEASSAAANPLLLDPVSQMLPWRRAAEDGLLFNPAEGSGAALLGNGQSALLFPTEVLARALTPFRAVTYSQAARLLVAVWGMFLLARGIALGEVAALFAAAAFAGSGFLQLWRLHPHSLVAATAPWIVLAAIALARRPGPRTAVALAAAGAVGFYGGHPETLLHVALFAGALALALVRRPWFRSRAAAAARGPRRPAGWLRRAGWGADAGVLAALLAAPALLPFVDNLTVSAEWRESRDARRSEIETPLREVGERLKPTVALLALGDPRDRSWRGPENLAELGGGAMGAVPLLLAFLAVAGRKVFAGPAGRITRLAGGRRLLAQALLVLGAVGLLVAAHLPWLSAPFGWVPLLRDSLLKRLVLWWVLALSLVTGLGVERLRRSAAVRARGWWTPLAAALAGLVLGANLVALTLAAPPAVRLRLFVCEVGAMAVAAVAAVVVRGSRDGGSASAPRVAGAPPPPASGRRSGTPPVGSRRPRLAGAVGLAALAAAVLVPRVVLLAGWVPLASAASFYPETLATRFVGERLAALGGQGYRVAGLDAAMPPHAAAFFGFEEARTNDPMGFAPYRSFLAAVGEVPRAGWVRVLDPARPALAFLGVRFVFDHPTMTARPGVEVAYHGRDAIVYENPRALARLFVPRRLAVEGDPEAAVAAAREIADFGDLAVVDRLPEGGDGGTWRSDPPADPAGGGSRANGAAAVTILEVDGGRIHATLDAAAPAVVATSQPAIPGWRIALDGEPLPAARRLTVNGAFLGVAIPAGRHELALRYAPASWRLGLALGVVGLLAAVALLSRGAGRGGRLEHGRRARVPGTRAPDSRPREGGKGGRGGEGVSR